MNNCVILRVYYYGIFQNKNENGPKKVRFFLFPHLKIRHVSCIPHIAISENQACEQTHF